MTQHTEYLRRNLVVASSIGAVAGCRVILDRLASNQRRAPKWLVDQVRGIKERAERTTPELATWRDAAPDAPMYVAMEAP